MKQLELFPSSDFARRLGAIMHRKLSSPWNVEKEIKKFRKLLKSGGIVEEELQLVERYYRANWPPRSDINHLRHNLAQLINNWQGEVDKARIWCDMHKAKVERIRKIIPLPRAAIGPAMSEDERRASADAFERLMGRRPAWEKQA